MESFRIHTLLENALIPMFVRQKNSITEDDLMEHQVSYERKGEELHSILTLDVSRWYPPMYLGEAEPPLHQPEVFVFCHDGQFNYRQAQAIGEAIMRYYDWEMDAERSDVTDLFDLQE